MTSRRSSEDAIAGPCPRTRVSWIGRARPRIAAATAVGTGFAGTIGMRAPIDRLLVGLVCASLTFVGCSSTKSAADPDGASSDGNAPPVDCRGGLGEVGQICPAMFDGAAENV